MRERACKARGRATDQHCASESESVATAVAGEPKETCRGGDPRGWERGANPHYREPLTRAAGAAAVEATVTPSASYRVNVATT